MWTAFTLGEFPERIYYLKAEPVRGSGTDGDILPFGHKDAYSNIYCYNSLARMAELEEPAGMILSEEDRERLDGPEPRPPEWYRGHMEKVKDEYTGIFWDDYAGVENLKYDGRLWKITVTRDTVEITGVKGGKTREYDLTNDQPVIFQPWGRKWK